MAKRKSRETRRERETINNPENVIDVDFSSTIDEAGVESAKNQENQKEEKINRLKAVLNHRYTQNTLEATKKLTGFPTSVGMNATKGGISGLWDTARGMFSAFKNELLKDAGSILPKEITDPWKAGRKTTEDFFKPKKEEKK